MAEDYELVPFTKDCKLDEYLTIDTRLMKGTWQSKLDVRAVVLHGYLLRLCSVSAKNGWIDDEGNVFVKLKLQEMANILGVSKKTALCFKQQLEDNGLITIPEKYKVNNSRHTPPIYVNVIKSKNSKIITMSNKADKNKNKFNNFQQNDYDMKEIERELLDN